MVDSPTAFRALLEAALGAIIAVDGGGRIALVNAQPFNEQSLLPRVQQDLDAAKTGSGES